MVAKVKVTISIDRQVLENIDRIARSRKVSRSSLFDAAVRALERAEMVSILREGYESMSKEDRETAEDSLSAAVEVMNEN